MSTRSMPHVGDAFMHYSKRTIYFVEAITIDSEGGEPLISYRSQEMIDKGTRPWTQEARRFLARVFHPEKKQWVARFRKVLRGAKRRDALTAPDHLRKLARDLVLQLPRASNGPLAPWSPTVQAFAVLMLIEARGDDATVGEVVRELGISQAQASVVVDMLVRAEIVERRTSKNDHRVKRLRLTTRGLQARRWTRAALLPPEEEPATVPEPLEVERVAQGEQSYAEPSDVPARVQGEEDERVHDD